MLGKKKTTKKNENELPLFNPNLLPSLLLLLAAAGAAVKEDGAGEENAGVIGMGGNDWKLASFGGGAKVAASSSLSLPVSTH